MANETYPLLNRNQVENPAAVGNSVLFRDKGNNGLLTAKNFDCSFTVLEVNQVSDEALKCICDRVEQIISDSGCALKQGMMSPDQYQDTIENLNLCLEVNVDSLTGSQQHCFTNQPTLFLSLSTTNVLCNGGSTGTAAVLVSGGEAPYTTVWQDLGGVAADPANLTAGSYTVTVTDTNGKSKSQSFIISEPSAIQGALSSTPETSGGANDGTATVVASGGTAPYTYLWDDGGAQTTATATGLAPGDYNVQVTDANGCVANFGPITVL